MIKSKLECAGANAPCNVTAALPNRWRPQFNPAKFGWCPLLECRAITLPRRETRWNLLGCPKLVNIDLSR